MISVVIPVPSHTASVAALIAFAGFHSAVTEVIVVDDGSHDYISESALLLHVQSKPGTLMGKGAAMLEGLRAAQNDIVLFLDGDLLGLREDLIEAMTQPLLSRSADMVKSKQTRIKARSAQSLAKRFFPELAPIEQPMDGILAARRSLLDSLQFDSGYGVNIGMLIDTALSGLSIAEVDVGNLDYDLQPLENLQDITSHFFRSLFKRAIRHGRLAAVQEQELSGEFPLQAKEMAFLRKQAKHPRRIALVDLDYVLLQTPLLVQLAQRTRNPFDSSDQIAGPALGTENISHTAAAFCRGSNRQFLEKVANSMVFKSGAKELVSELRGAGYQVILMSDGFHTIADVLRRRLNADWCIAHALKFDGEIATGKFVPSPAMIHSEGCRLHSLCRENILAHLSERMNIHPQRILVIGGGRQDACLLQAAGRSIGFQPETHETREAATTIVDSTLEHVLPEIRHKYAAK